MPGHGRKIATILAADVVEYSRLMGMDEPGTLAALKLRRALFERLVTEFEGREFGSVGDSLMAQFPSAVNAVQCAQAIQRAIAKENLPLALDRRMSLRIGVNLGDVIEEDGALFGDGVNVAARLQSLAAPNGILIAGAVYEHVKKKLPTRFNYAGVRHVKNIPDPVATYEVLEADERHPLLKGFLRYARRRRVGPIAVLMLLAAGVLWWTWRNDVGFTQVRSMLQPAQPVSLAVLPFVNMSPDESQEYFADGISEELLNLLSQVPELRVTARTSSFSFKGKDVDIAEIARKLNVAHVLEGSVRKSGDTLRITAQLVRASDSSRLWSQTYDRQMAEVFKVQDEIAATVVTQLRIKLLGSAPQVRQTDPNAYAFFLQGREIMRQYNAAAIEEAILLHRQALAIDPRFAPAWTELAAAYFAQVNLGLVTTDQGLPMAREAINQALANDPTYAAAYARLAVVDGIIDGDLAAAARHVEQGLARDPANLDLIISAGRIAGGLGRSDQAIALVEYLVARDPVNVMGYDGLGHAYRVAGRLDDALAQYRTVLKLSPGFGSEHYFLGEVLLLKGDTRAALAEIQQEPVESYRRLGLSMAYHALGRKAESDAALDEVIRKHEQTMAFNIAYALAWRGEADRAFEWLHKADTYRDLGLGLIARHPMLVSLHADPRWLPLLRRLGKAPEQLAAIKFDVTVPK
jgi:TolB-like protein/class 3 adenylate cyclase/Flp pilus assembly protein TadD